VWRCADENNITVTVLEGSCTFTLASKTYKLSAGDTILIPAGQDYIRRPIENTPCRFQYVHFKTAKPVSLISDDDYDDTLNRIEKVYYEKDLDFEEIFLPQVTHCSSNADEIIKKLSEISKDCRQATKASHISASLSVVQLLLMMQKSVLSQHFISSKIPSLSRQSHSPIQPAIEYIRKNFDQKISIEELQKVTNVSAQHLIRLFRKDVNMTPVEYINHVKILHAVEFLRSSSLSVEEISYKLSFTSPSYFGRVFKQFIGRTPSEERHRIKTFAQQKK
jgi:AraC-like DNA-binding protein